jgi:hypothetical protein
MLITTMKKILIIEDEETVRELSLGLKPKSQSESRLKTTAYLVLVHFNGLKL